ncbi:hypothetical protein, partial [Klebsiella pneumoniae]
AVSSGQSPIKVVEHRSEKSTGHGSKITVNITRNYVDSEQISDIISARFLFNPEFHVYVNGRKITLLEHPG